MRDYYALTADEREAERERVAVDGVTLGDLYNIIGTMNSQDHYYLALDEMFEAVVARRYGEGIIEDGSAIEADPMQAQRKGL